MMCDRVEVLPMMGDRDRALEMLDFVQNQLREAAATYEQLVTLVENGAAAAMSVDEIAHRLSAQAAPMREALLALKPHVEDMRDGDGHMGPVLQGIGGALDALHLDSQSVSVVRAFGLVCAVCCAMERDLAGIRTARNAAPLDFHAGASQALVMDQHLVDALGYLLHAHWHEVRPSRFQRPTIGRAARLYIRRLHNPSEPLDRMDVEVLTTLGLWATTSWTDLALRAPVYIDVVERLNRLTLTDLPKGSGPLQREGKDQKCS